MLKKGEIIRVTIARNLNFGPEHYGVYDGKGGVYHFTGFNPDNAKIVYTSIDAFADGGKVYVDSYPKAKYTPEEIIKRAESKVGSDFGRYNIIYNNCEHFANWCVTGVRQSMQSLNVNPNDDKRDIVEKGIDNIFNPLINLGDKIDKKFKMGDYKETYEDGDTSEISIDNVIESILKIGKLIDNIFDR